jgi:hypothetical protein
VTERDHVGRSVFCGISPAILLVPRIIGRGHRGSASELVIHAVAAEASRGWEGGEWRAAHRAREESVFGHVATSACWRVEIDMTRGGDPPPQAVQGANGVYDDEALPDAIMTSFGAQEAGDATTLVLRLPPDSEVLALLDRAATGRACIPARLRTMCADSGDDVWVAEVVGPRGWWTGQHAADLRQRVRDEHERLALKLAKQARSLLPPLPETVSWETSDVHRAARAIARDLGGRAYRKGWTRAVLGTRVVDAVSFLLNARGGVNDRLKFLRE